jgi:hypothetical protein
LGVYLAELVAAEEHLRVSGVVAGQAIISVAGVIEGLARTTEDASTAIPRDRVAVREAGGGADDSVLTVADSGYFHFVSPFRRQPTKATSLMLKLGEIIIWEGSTA